MEKEAKKSKPSDGRRKKEEFSLDDVMVKVKLFSSFPKQCVSGETRSGTDTIQFDAEVPERLVGEMYMRLWTRLKRIELLSSPEAVAAARQVAGHIQAEAAVNDAVQAQYYKEADEILALLAPELEKAAKWDRVVEIANNSHAVDSQGNEINYEAKVIVEALAEKEAK